MGKEIDRVKPKNPEKWFANEVTAGIKKLYVLSLPGTPGSDAIAATTGVWISILWNKNIGWNQKLDSWRIQQAFEELIGEIEQWPSPKMLFDRLPKRSQPPAPPETMTYEQRKANVARLKKMMSGVG